MPDQMISDNDGDRMVREDTAKGFRWNRFIGIIFAGFLVILIVGILFFSGAFTAVQPNMNPTNTSNQNRNPGP
jgi:hypothetical protein